MISPWPVRVTSERTFKICPCEFLSNEVHALLALLVNRTFTARLNHRVGLLCGDCDHLIENVGIGVFFSLHPSPWLSYPSDCRTRHIHCHADTRLARA